MIQSSSLRTEYVLYAGLQALAEDYAWTIAMTPVRCVVFCATPATLS